MYANAQRSIYLQLSLSFGSATSGYTLMIAILQAIQNNEERNRVQTENSEDNQYVDKVYFSPLIESC
jgi:hypothetical protein